MSICNSKKRETGPDPRETLQPATSRATAAIAAAARPSEKKEGQEEGKRKKDASSHSQRVSPMRGLVRGEK